MTDETLKLNTPPVSEVAPEPDLTASEREPRGIFDLALPPLEVRADGSPDTDAEREELHGGEEKIVIDVDGESVDMLTLPSVKVADLLVDEAGNISVLRDTASAFAEDVMPAAEEPRHPDSLTPLDKDVFTGARDTGPEAEVLLPLPDDVYSHARVAPTSDRDMSGDGRRSVPLLVPIMSTDVDKRAALNGVAPNRDYYGRAVPDAPMYAPCSEAEFSAVGELRQHYPSPDVGGEYYAEPQTGSVDDYRRYSSEPQTGSAGDYRSYSAEPQIDSAGDYRAYSDEPYYPVGDKAGRISEDLYPRDSATPRVVGNSSAGGEYYTFGEAARSRDGVETYTFVSDSEVDAKMWERARNDEMYYLLEEDRRQRGQEEKNSDRRSSDRDRSEDKSRDKRSGKQEAKRFDKQEAERRDGSAKGSEQDGYAHAQSSGGTAGPEAVYNGYEQSYDSSEGVTDYLEPAPESKAVARYYSARKRVNRRLLGEQSERDVRCVTAKAQSEVCETEISLCEAELAFGKKDMTAIEKNALRHKRARVKGGRRELTRVRKTAEKRNERYYTPLLRAEELISSSLNPEATAALIERLETLLQKRDGINARLIEMYTGAQRGNRGSFKGRCAYVEKHLRRARAKQARLAKAIRKNSVPREDRVRLYAMMNEWVSLNGRIKGIEYMLNRERASGAAAGLLRRERRMLVEELERVGRELNRTELETIRRARTGRSIRVSMLVGWGALAAVVGLGVLAYVFREPLWELVRGWINSLFDVLGWTYFGRL